MGEKQKNIWIVNKVNESTADILLYGFIDPFDVNASDFTKELRSLEKDYTTINVRINSGGGSVFEGIAIYNAIKQSKCTINTYIDGLAASMASIIAIAGKKVYMSKSARLMTHQPSSGSYGTSDDMKKNAELLEGLEKTMCAIYAGKTGKTADECKTAFMNGKDNWFTAQEAINAGLVDELYDDEGVQMPKQTASIRTVYDDYQHQFAAKFQQSQKQDMETINISAASKAALGITGEVKDFAALDIAIASLKAKADQVDAANAAKVKAESDLADLQKETVKNDVTAQLEKAVTEKRITVEQQNIFAELYAEKPEDLKKLLATMKPFESVVAKTEATDADKAELAALMAMSGDKLFNDGKFARLKELSPVGYKAKYKEAFGDEPEKEEAAAAE